MSLSKKNIKRALFIYWVLAVYIVAALVWWFIELSSQNDKIASIQLEGLSKTDVQFSKKHAEILRNKKTNTAQYLGEGGLFLVLIIAGATFVIRAFKKEMRSTANQQNFLMAITHELKTPISVTKLNLETIQKHKLTDAQYQKILDSTLQETERLDSLCNNLLLSSQIEANGYKINKDNIDLSLLVKECVHRFIARHNYREIVINIDEDIDIFADAFLLQIAINNLIENSLKYSPKDKGIKIELKSVEKNVVLKVVDSGPGIMDEEKAAVFKKFYRSGNEATKRAKGTGLGLYISQRIVNAHDGNIAIENNPLGGSIFVVSLNKI